MRSMALRTKRGLSTMCLCLLLFTIPFAASGYAADKDDRPAARRTVIVPRYYYAYPIGPRLGWNRWGGGWGPRYWDPFWNPYPGYYYQQDTTGKVKIHDSVKTDQVFVNEAFAGSAYDVKTMSLNPGRYTIAIRRDGRNIMNSVVYVVTGKTVKIDVDKAA